VGALEEGDQVGKRENILSCLKKIRSLFINLENEEDILKEISHCDPSRYMVFPCDIIELRKFFMEDKISFQGTIPFFSKKFANKYLKDYSIFLIVDSHTGIMNGFYGGIQVNYCNELPLSSLLTRIIVNEPYANNSFNTVKDLVNEFNLGVECLVSNDIPGVFESRKLSYNIEKKRDYNG
jgi:hypothetical protein